MYFSKKKKAVRAIDLMADYPTSIIIFSFSCKNSFHYFLNYIMKDIFGYIFNFNLHEDFKLKTKEKKWK